MGNVNIVDVCLFLVAPDAIHNYVKTYKHQKRNMHFIAPEYGKFLFI